MSDGLTWLSVDGDSIVQMRFPVAPTEWLELGDEIQVAVALADKQRLSNRVAQQWNVAAVWAAAVWANVVVRQNPAETSSDAITVYTDAHADDVDAQSLRALPEYPLFIRAVDGRLFAVVDAVLDVYVAYPRGLDDDEPKAPAPPDPDPGDAPGWSPPLTGSASIPTTEDDGHAPRLTAVSSPWEYTAPLALVDLFPPPAATGLNAGRRPRGWRR